MMIFGDYDVDGVCGTALFMRIMSSLGVNLKFNIDERTDMVQVEVRDPKTDKLIRKIPADEMLDLAASIENMVGLFLNKAL